ncbi:MAG TPA: aldo/keto reductase [Candidatus Eisenbacteria bacterium]|nr:aldo/keto reductase [Candidatus Eisenbacteria bacterium]
MRYRPLGKTGFTASEMGFGAWAIGADWGAVDDEQSLRALHAAADAGVTFFDTADVYGDGRSERLIARFRKERREPIVIATKMGRRGLQDVKEFTQENFAAWIDRSRENLEVDRLDLVQLHCPPTDVYYRPEVFDALDGFVQDGRIASYGVSVERVEEGLKAIEYPNVATVQIIYNMFRQRPAERFLSAARERNVGVIARVPLASGLLTGKFNRDTRFSATDHRNFNRHGESFDVGETFAGVDFETALEVVEELRALVPADATMAQMALRWILMNDAVSTVIPGAKTPEQASANAAAAGLHKLPESTMDRIETLYRERIAPLVHQRW